MISKDDEKYYTDLKRNRIIEEFLDSYLYIDGAKRITNRKMQNRGYDVVYKDWIIDEKSNIDWKGKHPNEILQTFLTELSITLDDEDTEYEGYTNEGKKYRYNGFLSDYTENNAYLFIWIDKCNFLPDGTFYKEDIKEVEVALVEKIKLEEYLNKKKFTKSKLKNIVDKIYLQGKGFERNGLRFWLNKYSKEQSVAVIIPREDLKKIATKTTKITRE